MAVHALRASILLLWGLATISSALTPLSGLASGVLPPGEYVATGTLLIPPGTSLRMMPGCRIYFENFSGVSIDGSLFCDGTVDSPVVLTSVAEIPGSAAAPQSFDWNGVEATEKASDIRLSNTTLAHSVLGLKVISTKTRIYLDEVTFNENGTGNFWRAKRYEPVMNGVRASFFCRAGCDTCELGGQTDSASLSTTHRADRITRKPITWRLPVRLSLGAAGVAGAAMWIAGHMSAEDNQRKYQSADQVHVAEYRDKRDKAVVVRNVGAVISVICLPTLAVTFFF